MKDWPCEKTVDFDVGPKGGATELHIDGGGGCQVTIRIQIDVCGKGGSAGRAPGGGTFVPPDPMGGEPPGPDECPNFFNDPGASTHAFQFRMSGIDPNESQHIWQDGFYAGGKPLSVWMTSQTPWGNHAYRGFGVADLAGLSSVIVKLGSEPWCVRGYGVDPVTSWGATIDSVSPGAASDELSVKASCTGDGKQRWLVVMPMTIDSAPTSWTKYLEQGGQFDSQALITGGSGVAHTIKVPELRSGRQYAVFAAISSKVPTAYWFNPEIDSAVKLYTH